MLEFEWFSEKERQIAAEKVRIITAREATPQERRIYYGEDNKGFWFIP